MQQFKNIFNLEDKHVVITGANGLLGKPFTEALLEHGARVSLIDLHFDEDWKARLNTDSPERVGFYLADITNIESLEINAIKMEKKHGAIQVLLSNAATKGRNADKFFDLYEQYNKSTWQEIMDVNLNSMFYVTQTFGKRMAAQGAGSIILTSSIYGVVAPDQSIYEGSLYNGVNINTPAVYSASKSGVIGLTKYLASYWGRKNIRVNALVPGGVESGQNETFKTNYSRKVPLGRMGKPHDLAGALIYLASDASSYYTGQALIVDGGFCAW